MTYYCRELTFKQRKHLKITNNNAGKENSSFFKIYKEHTIIINVQFFFNVEQTNKIDELELEIDNLSCLKDKVK